MRLDPERPSDKGNVVTGGDIHVYGFRMYRSFREEFVVEVVLRMSGWNKF